MNTRDAPNPPQIAIDHRYQAAVLEARWAALYANGESLDKIIERMEATLDLKLNELTELYREVVSRYAARLSRGRIIFALRKPIGDL